MRGRGWWGYCKLWPQAYPKLSRGYQSWRRLEQLPVLFPEDSGERLLQSTSPASSWMFLLFTVTSTNAVYYPPPSQYTLMPRNLPKYCTFMNSTTGLSSELSLVYFYRMYSELVILPRLNCTQVETGLCSRVPLQYSFIHGFSTPLSSEISSKAMVSS